MDSLRVAQVVGSDMTVSDKIRALDAAGYPRAEIARALGKRYQHVRNVLEADRLHPPRGARSDSASLEPSMEGLREAGVDFAASTRLTVDADGAIRLPPELLSALQAKPGAVIIAEMQDDGLKLFTNLAAWDRVRRMAQAIGFDPNRDMVAELLAERRAEAAQDD